MNETFVLTTDDKNFKEVISDFLSKHCKKNNVNVAIYEMNDKGANDVMKIVKEK